MWDECIEVPHATKSVWDESHTSHTVPAPMVTGVLFTVTFCFSVTDFSAAEQPTGVKFCMKV